MLISCTIIAIVTSIKGVPVCVITHVKYLPSYGPLRFTQCWFKCQYIVFSCSLVCKCVKNPQRQQASSFLMTRPQETLLTNKLAGPYDWEDIDPLHVSGNAANLEYRTIRFFLQKRKFLLFCPPDWLHSHRCARGLLLACFWRLYFKITKVGLKSLTGMAAKFCKSTFWAYEVH